MDVLVVYSWCTFGGVERVVLNRAQAFRKGRRKVRLAIGFLHDYQGNLPAYQEQIRRLRLEDRLSAFLIREGSFPDPDEYDLVLNIDAPQAFGSLAGARNHYLECHTPYAENRRYLTDLPEDIRGVLVPSESFKALIESECGRLPPVHVLPNPVGEEFLHIPRTPAEDIFPRAPIAYLARLDELKNVREAVRIFRLCSGDERIMFAVVGWGAEEETLHAELTAAGILGKTFLRDRMPFRDIPAFVGMVRDCRGVFLSPSKGESFGLSAAEFISAGVPVLLSDIPPHRELVEGDERHLYALGDDAAAREKILCLLDHWEEAAQRTAAYGRKFSAASFLRAWQSFLDSRT